MAETVVVILYKEDQSLPKLGNFTTDTGLTRAPDDCTIKSTCKTSARKDYNLPSTHLHIYHE